MLSLVVEELKVSHFLICFVLFWRVSKEPTSSFFSHDEDDPELGTRAGEKSKIDSELGITSNDKYDEVLRSNAMFFDITVNDFVKFKVHEYNQIHHETVSYVDMTIWQMIHYHFFALQDDYLQYVRDFIIRETKCPFRGRGRMHEFFHRFNYR